MPTFPIRFGRGQGLELRGNEKTQRGLLELENVELGLDDVIGKRAGHAALPLLDPNDVPIDPPIECWFREEELAISDGGALYVRRECEYPGRFDARGPWTRTRLRVETAYDAGAHPLVQAGAVRVRDASGVCDVVATQRLEDEVNDIRWDVLDDTGERWPLTPTTSPDAIDPLAFNSADNRAVLSYLVPAGLEYRYWLKGTSLPAPRFVSAIDAANLYDGDGGVYEGGGEYVAFIYLEAPATVRLEIHWYAGGGTVDVDTSVSLGVITTVQAVAIHAVGDSSYAGARLALAVSGLDAGGVARSRVLVRNYLAGTGALDTEPLAVDRFVAAAPVTVRAVAVGFLGAQLDPAMTTAEVRTEVLAAADQLPRVHLDRIEPGVFGTQLQYRGSALYSALELLRGQLVGVLSVVELGDSGPTTPTGFHDRRRLARSGFLLIGLRRFFLPGFPTSLSAVVGEVVGRFAALQGELFTSDRSSNVRVTRRVQRLSANLDDLVTGLAAEGDEPNLRTLAQVVRWDTTPRPNRPAEIGGVAVSAHGGYPRMYAGVGTDNGLAAVEHDWHTLPLILSAAASAGGGNLSAGKYGVALTWEWTDGRGTLYRASPWFVSSITVNANDRILVNWRPLWHSERQDVRAVWWRTLANGQIYYRESVERAYVPTQDVGITYLSISDAQISGTADETNIQTLDQVSGSTLASVPAPITDWVAAAGQRLWGPDPAQGQVVRFSIPSSVGRAPHWTLAQAIEAPSSERATALAELDGRVVLFTPRAIGYTQGDGPDERGNGVQFPVLARLAADSGALSHEAVAEVPDGLFFGSPSELRLLTRSLAVVDMGASIQRPYEADGERARMLCYDAMRTTLRVANDAGAAAGRFFRWHSPSRRWASDTGIDPLDVAASRNGQIVLVTRDGRVLVLDETTWTDGGVPYTTRLSSPWLHEPTRDGLVHSTLIVSGATVYGERMGAHGLAWDIYFDYEASARLSPSNPAATITARDAAGKPYVYRAEWAGVPCFAARVVLSDGAATTAGWRLSGLDITWLPDGGPTEHNWEDDALAQE